MKAIAVARKEGGEWIDFKPDREGRWWKGCNGEVHAIKFDNGVIWDTVNGWRRNTLPRVRVPMGRA